ncbi:MAG: PHP domain-containing protein [Clostridiales bacterium]|jgi:PHP family Zn ribbon phosphoesterase|nr:PHP domain-containing protein [Clostridiales bacterium]
MGNSVGHGAEYGMGCVPSAPRDLHCDLHYDLHIHSCLSPCADDDMTVHNIANMAMLCGLDIIALTDHNTLKNCPPFFAACKSAGVIPVAGVEINTREEVHVLCFFPSLDSAMDFDGFLYPLLPDIKNRPDIFGRQIILGGDDNPMGEEQKLLISACGIGIDELPALMASYGGTAVPAHIDRPSNSLIANLGFIPEEYAFSCYEVKDLSRLPALAESNPALAGKTIISNSDAHTLVGIPEKSHCLRMGAKSAKALIEALG